MVFGRSEIRPSLRRHFEVDAETITVATLYRLAETGQLDRKIVAKRSRTWASTPTRPIRLQPRFLSLGG